DLVVFSTKKYKGCEYTLFSLFLFMWIILKEGFVRTHLVEGIL
ncbi:hypothetical protein LCGC14_2507410, partial [marine sediment metagenome]